MQKLIDLITQYSWLYTLPWKWSADKKSIIITVSGAQYLVTPYQGK
jgi:hypothetical protein